ncbi:type 1 glutamine amidotransferase domain-containing protein [Carbonactinospora thermoautotrophica]|nr:type 1 glutamine amidotransferase domain-containing protein [Carbonactinospora thermoautotrophica]MCX9191058.1 type 1 glutamine amidotransferase domain-containing protein [Carbonactinospora thermoautotrophica]
MSTVLMVVSASNYWTLADGTRHPSGYWTEELVVPHRAFREGGLNVVVATPEGIAPTADPASLTPEMNGGDEAKVAEMRAYLDKISAELAKPARLEDVDPAAVDALFIPGGHGPMEDLARSEALGALLVRLLDDGKLVSAVCHGPAGLLSARREDGTWAFNGYRVTAFTNVEEGQVGFADKASWLLEDRLRSEGGVFEAGEPWQPYVVVDRTVVTGQNPASSEPLAAKVIDLLSVKASS